MTREKFYDITITMRENFYVGGQMYSIAYCNGTHHIFEINWYDNDECIEDTVFTGRYEQCLKKKKEINDEYLESILF